MNIKIIDDFLLKEDFEKLCKLELKRLKNNQIHVYHNEISGNKIIKNDLLEKDFLFHLNKKYTDRGLEILRELCPEKLNLYEYSDFTLIHTGSNYKFPIHDDTPNKLLSGVIYLKPEVNKGTFFYNDKEGNEKKEIEWKNKGYKEVGIDLLTNKIIIKLDKKYFRAGEVDYLKGNYTKAKNLLKWKPKYSINQVIDEMIAAEFKLYE